MDIKTRTSWKQLKDHVPPYYIFPVPEDSAKEVIFDSLFDGVVCSGSKNIIDAFIRVELAKVKKEFRRRVTYYRYKMDSVAGYKLDYSYIDKGSNTPNLQSNDVR